jgi:hypothetical protein
MGGDPVAITARRGIGGSSAFSGDGLGKRGLSARGHNGGAGCGNHAGTCQKGATCDPGLFIFHEDSSAMPYRWMIYL